MSYFTPPSHHITISSFRINRARLRCSSKIFCLMITTCIYHTNIKRRNGTLGSTREENRNLEGEHGRGKRQLTLCLDTCVKNVTVQASVISTSIFITSSCLSELWCCYCADLFKPRTNQYSDSADLVRLHIHSG